MNSSTEEKIRIVDSHTGGEPTRVVIAGGPAMDSASMRQRRDILQNDHDWLRSAVVNEPRGSDVMVGAILSPPVSSKSAAAVIFFNNVGYLGMCGHGSIGLAVTLAHLDRLHAGEHQFETPAGNVEVTLHDANTVSVNNVRSYRFRQNVSIQVPEIGEIHGDIAWGGNWFFLVSEHDQELCYENVGTLTDFTWAIRRELDAQGIRGADGSLVDHVELFGPPSDASLADSKNFVLCPGKAYDRSPCGTGTSAKVACLTEDGKLPPGTIWRQESIIGSVFEAHVNTVSDEFYPVIKGTAYITGEATLHLDPNDPFRYGLTGG